MKSRNKRRVKNKAGGGEEKRRTRRDNTYDQGGVKNDIYKGHKEKRNLLLMISWRI